MSKRLGKSEPPRLHELTLAQRAQLNDCIRSLYEVDGKKIIWLAETNEIIDAKSGDLSQFHGSNGCKSLYDPQAPDDCDRCKSAESRPKIAV